MICCECQWYRLQLICAIHYLCSTRPKTLKISVEDFTHQIVFQALLWDDDDDVIGLRAV